MVEFVDLTLTPDSVQECLSPEMVAGLKETILQACVNSMYLGILIGAVMGGFIVWMYFSRKSFDALQGDE